MTRITAKLVFIIGMKLISQASGRNVLIDRRQPLVEPAVASHQADPGIDAQQERGPERQDDQHQQDIAPDAVARAIPRAMG